MKSCRLVATLILFSLGTNFTAAGREILFDADWRFTLGDPLDAEQPQFDHSQWDQVELPHDWSIKGPISQENATGSPGGFFPAGVGWYRKTFVAPADSSKKQLTIRFDGVYMLAEVWMNGRKLGTHPNGYTPFSYDLTRYVKPGMENTIAVRVDNSRQLNSRWYTGSGIYKHVWLDVQEPIHLQPGSVWVRTLSADKGTAKLKIGASAENESGSTVPSVEFATEIFAPIGKVTAWARPWHTWRRSRVPST